MAFQTPPGGGPRFSLSDASTASTMTVASKSRRKRKRGGFGLGLRKRSTDSRIARISLTDSSVMTSMFEDSRLGSDIAGDDRNPPCDGDPFWEYYIAVGVSARAMPSELWNAMHHIGGEDILHRFMKTWMHLHLTPGDLPNMHANNEGVKRIMDCLRPASVSPSVIGGATTGFSSHRPASLGSMGSPSITALSSYPSSESPMAAGISVRSKSPSPSPGLERPKSIHSRLRSEMGTPQFVLSETTSAPTTQRTGSESPPPPSALRHHSSLESLRSSPSPRSGILVPGITLRLNSVQLLTRLLTSMRAKKSHPRIFYIPFFRSIRAQLQKEAQRCEERYKRKFEREQRVGLRAAYGTLAPVHITGSVAGLRRGRVREKGAKRQMCVHTMDVWSHLLHPDLSHNVVWNRWMLIVGLKIFQYCDQRTFLNASRVCRSWFFTSRMESARSHVRVRMPRTARYLSSKNDLNNLLSTGGKLVALNFSSKNPFRIFKYEGTAKSKRESDRTSIGTGSEHAYAIDEEHSDLSPTGGGASLVARSRRMVAARDRGVGACNFPYFFTSRRDSLYDGVRQLDLDLSVLSQRGIVYWMNKALVNGYWETVKTLLRIETLTSLDLILPDPQTQSAAYMVNNSEAIISSKIEAERARRRRERAAKLSSPPSAAVSPTEKSVTWSTSKSRALSPPIVDRRAQQIQFPPILIPADKFCVTSSTLKSMRLAVRSLSTAELEAMVETHFKSFYFNYDDSQLVGRFPDIRHKFVATDASRHTKRYRANPVYYYCINAVRKPYLFDVTNALKHLNGARGKKCRSLETLSLVDVRVSEHQFENFLMNNKGKLRSLTIRYTPNGIVDLFGVATDSVKIDEDTDGKRGRGHGRSGGRARRRGRRSSNFDKVVVQMTNVLTAVDTFLRKASASFEYANRRELQKLREKMPDGKKSKRMKALFKAHKFVKLPLDELHLVFPRWLTQKHVAGAISVFDTLGTPEFDVLAIDSLQLEGCLLTPDVSSAISWPKVFASQKIRALVVKDFLYVPKVFKSLANSFAATLTSLFLEVKFEKHSSADELTALQESHSAADGGGGESHLSIARMFTSKKKEKPLKQILESLRSCHQLRYFRMDVKQHKRSQMEDAIRTRGRSGTVSGRRMPPVRGGAAVSSHSRKESSEAPVWLPSMSSSASLRRMHTTEGRVSKGSDRSSGSREDSATAAAASLHKCGSAAHASADDWHSAFGQRITGDNMFMEPTLRLLWIDDFVRAKRIKKSLQVLDIRFRELDTSKFEQRDRSVTKFKKHRQVHGHILRVNPEFAHSVQKHIDGWFSITEKRVLRTVRLVRKLNNVIGFADCYGVKEEKSSSDVIDFGDDSRTINFWAEPKMTDDREILYQQRLWTQEDHEETWEMDIVGDKNMPRILMSDVPLG